MNNEMYFIVLRYKNRGVFVDTHFQWSVMDLVMKMARRRLSGDFYRGLRLLRPYLGLYLRSVPYREIKAVGSLSNVEFARIHAVWRRRCKLYGAFVPFGKPSKWLKQFSCYRIPNINPPLSSDSVVYKRLGLELVYSQVALQPEHNLMSVPIVFQRAAFGYYKAAGLKGPKNRLVEIIRYFSELSMAIEVKDYPWHRSIEEQLAYAKTLGSRIKGIYHNKVNLFGGKLFYESIAQILDGASIFKKLPALQPKHKLFMLQAFSLDEVKRMNSGYPSVRDMQILLDSSISTIVAGWYAIFCYPYIRFYIG